MIDLLNLQLQLKLQVIGHQKQYNMYLLNLLLVMLMCTVGLTIATLNLTLQETSYRVCGWRSVFPSSDTKVILKKVGKFLPRNIISTRFQMNGHNVYITQPRYKSGVSATLTRVNLGTTEYELSPVAYPDWNSQDESNCDAIQSAVDVFLDRNFILWVLDAGIKYDLEIPNKVCAPKVVAISVVTNRILKTIDLTPFTITGSPVQFIVVENTSGGDDYLFISDPKGNAIIVFNASAGYGKRFLLPPEIKSACADTDALYMSLIRKAENYLYFTYSNCGTVFSIPTSSLTQGNRDVSIKLAAKISQPLVLLGTDGQQKIFFRISRQPYVYAWNTNNELPSEGWTSVWSGDPERVATCVSRGLYNANWVLESNFMNYVFNSTGCLGDCSRLSPIV